MHPDSGDLAQIRMNEYRRQAERSALVSTALRERKAARRERTALAALRPVRLARLLASAAVGILRS